MGSEAANDGEPTTLIIRKTIGFKIARCMSGPFSAGQSQMGTRGTP
jgi:hypothetical protein